MGETIECPECDGYGDYLEDFEPIPGGGRPGDERMGQSVRCKVRCDACNGRGTVTREVE